MSAMLSDNIFLVALLVLILVVLTILGLVFYFAVKGSSTKPAADPKLVKMRFDSLRSSFRQAVELIEGNIAARSKRYSIPWVLVLNESSQAGTLPIEQSGVPSALSSESASAATSEGISWHFFDKGVVVEMKGAYLGSPDDENSAEKPWDEFLSLCRGYRPQRPFDSVVITVPAQMLMDSSPDASPKLTKLARLAHRRLWLAQNRFAMRFAVYVAVSGCERIEGFTTFARALPESMRAGMLGWSSPYDLSTTYQDGWVDEAVGSVVRTVSDTTAELFAAGKPDASTAGFYLLPSHIDDLRKQLQLYVDELMRPSAYHEPFFFRGLYFTGDSGVAAQTAGALGNEANVIAGDDAPDENFSISELMQEPAFLRDLFEKKIFMEYGLARPSRQQLTRPALTRVARVGAVLVVGGWSIGLVVATLQLNKRNAEVVTTLLQIEADNQYRIKAMNRGELVPAAWYKSRTLKLLSSIEDLGESRTWSMFMPGSWSYWDSLAARVRQRVEREFGDIAIGTLQRELYARAADLTGVALDESTSELVIGGECTAPQVAQGQMRKAVLAVEDTPEFTAMVQYLNAVTRLEQAIVAMQRLQKGEINESDDLRLLVKYTLGAELPANISHSMRLFQGVQKVASGGMGVVSVDHMQQAVRCTLAKGMSALDQRIFVNNDLLVLERQLATQVTRLLSSDSRATGFKQTVAGYKEILGIIRDEENLLSAGRGGWMRQTTPVLGANYDAALEHIADSELLLGPESAERASQQTKTDFQWFVNEFNTRFGSETESGVSWDEKESRFILSPDRLALREALTNLLAQPFMSVTADRELPEMVSQGILTWDTSKLDQTIGLSEMHKRFMGESLVKFPQASRASVIAFVNGQFARLVNDRLVDALTIRGRIDPGNLADAAAFDAARERLTKIQDFLKELSSYEVADGLRRLVSLDAVGRLKQLDNNLKKYDLYATRGRDFSYWMGDPGPMLQAFGVTDSQAMAQYLAVQFSRAETMGRQSEIYLASFDKAASEGQLALRWQAINREMEAYRLKNPNSSLVVYELFLNTIGIEVDSSTCGERMRGKAPGRAGDYFGERHVQVYNALLKRCNELRFSEQQALWSKFSSGFNQLLSNRHPFANPLAKDLLDADYDDVGQSFKTSEKIARVLKDSALGNRSSSQSFAARKFSEQYERIRTFMAPLYPSEEGAIAGFDVGVEFRANQSAEIGGNKVIDWSLAIGSQVIKLRDAPRPLHWEPGAPVTLTLRLAKDIPANAFADSQQPNMSVNGKTVTYRFADTWSLLRMVQRHREEDANSKRDGRTQLLRMEFPMGTGTLPGKGAQPDEQAKVFLRLTISAAGKRTPLAWPMSFPTSAPEFNGQ